MELRTPPIQLSRLLNLKNFNNRLQLLASHDYGESGSVNLLNGEDPNIILQSMGVGLRFAAGVNNHP